MYMPFGCHRGKHVNEVPLSYLRWMIREGVRLDPDLRRMVLARLRLEDMAAEATPSSRTANSFDASAGFSAADFFATTAPTGNKDAAKALVMRCFKKLSLAFHPDRGGNTERMTALNIVREELMRMIEREM
jgi:hypothetical protein